MILVSGLLCWIPLADTRQFLFGVSGDGRITLFRLDDFHELTNHD